MNNLITTFREKDINTIYERNITVHGIVDPDTGYRIGTIHAAGSSYASYFSSREEAGLDELKAIVRFMEEGDTNE